MNAETNYFKCELLIFIFRVQFSICEDSSEVHEKFPGICTNESHNLPELVMFLQLISDSYQLTTTLSKDGSYHGKQDFLTSALLLFSQNSTKSEDGKMQKILSLFPHFSICENIREKKDNQVL